MLVFLVNLPSRRGEHELLKEKGISEEQTAEFYAASFDMAITTGSTVAELEALRERVGAGASSSSWAGLSCTRGWMSSGPTGRRIPKRVSDEWRPRNIQSD